MSSLFLIQAGDDETVIMIPSLLRRSVMSLLSRFIILALAGLLAVDPVAAAEATDKKTTNQASESPPSSDAAVLERKASEAQARIRANQDDADALKRAVKLNEVPSAKDILLRHGFTAKDLENTKIILRTGGGKGGEDTIEIFTTCCDPREITIRRTLENFTK
jgi:hypothetical protein